MAPSGRGRADATRARILDATALELSLRGDAGLRIEHVALRAQCNKALVYRYFGDRETLIREALRARFAVRERLLAAQPPSLAEGLVHWTWQTADDPTFARLILREALSDDGAPPVLADERSDYYARQVDGLRQMQAAGEIREDLDAEMLFLALLAVIMLPSSLPQIVRLAVGLEPGSEEFRDRWSRLLANLADNLAPRDQPGRDGVGP